MSPTHTLAELAAYQQSKKIYAFSLGEDDRRLARLRALHTKKFAELNTYSDLVKEAMPDLVLRTADGRELVLRLPSETMESLCCNLRQVLEDGLRVIEETVVDHLAELEEEAAIRSLKQNNSDDDLRPAILALCQPTAPTTQLSMSTRRAPARPASAAA